MRQWRVPCLYSTVAVTRVNHSLVDVVKNRLPYVRWAALVDKRTCCASWTKQVRLLAWREYRKSVRRFTSRHCRDDNTSNWSVKSSWSSDVGVLYMLDGAVTYDDGSHVFKVFTHTVEINHHLFLITYSATQLPNIAGQHRRIEWVDAFSVCIISLQRTLVWKQPIPYIPLEVLSWVTPVCEGINSMEVGMCIVQACFGFRTILQKFAFLSTTSTDVNVVGKSVYVREGPNQSDEDVSCCLFGRWTIPLHLPLRARSVILIRWIHKWSGSLYVCMYVCMYVKKIGEKVWRPKLLLNKIQNEKDKFINWSYPVPFRVDSKSMHTYIHTYIPYYYDILFGRWKLNTPFLLCWFSLLPINNK